MNSKEIYDYINHLEKQNTAIKKCLVARIEHAKKNCKTSESLILIQKFEEILYWANEFDSNTLSAESLDKIRHEIKNNAN